MEIVKSYKEMIKPSWAPPAWVFAPVWGLLYLGIAISFGSAILLYKGRMFEFIVLLPFLLNILFNLAFTTIQFKFKNNFLAAFDILLVLATLIWAMIAIYPYALWITYIQIPYLLWASFATVLQLTITYLNR